MPHCYKKEVEEQRWWGYCVNALSGLCLIATIDQRQQEFDEIMSVSMPSRASTSFLCMGHSQRRLIVEMCQCPLGLLPHFYERRNRQEAVADLCVNALSGCYLISTRSWIKYRSKY